MKKVLITGVAGLLGSQLADWVLAHTDYEVVGIDNLSGGYKENVDPRVHFYAQDLIDSGLDSIFKEHKPEFVFHFAAYAAEGLSPFIRTFNYTNNTVATAAVVNACIKYDVKRLVFTSSMAVYGHGNPPFTESDQPAPIDPYGVAKYASEMDIRIAGEQHGLAWSIIRPHNVYGPKQNIWDKYRNVLGIWMRQHLDGLPLTIFGDGMQTRAFSYILDCVEPIWKAAVDPRASRQVINVGGTSEIAIKDAAALVSEVVGGAEIQHLEARHEVKNAFSTWQKSVELLDYADHTSLKDGLTAMWEWAKTQPKRPVFEWPSYELDKGIYSFWKKG